MEQGYGTQYCDYAVGWMVPGFNFQQGLETFLFSNMSRLAMGLTQPPIQWLLGVVSPEVKLYVYFHMCLQGMHRDTTYLHLMLCILQVQRLMSHVTQRDRQHTHQLRKKEYEIVHIQEQLRHSLGLGCPAARHNHKHHKSSRNPACATCSGSTSHVSSNSEERDSTT
jgi:hypothetical protein